MSAALDALLDELTERVARRVVDLLRAGDQPGFVDQASSPLGARRHCSLARKLISEGKGDAAHIGRRWLIRRERLERDMGATTKPTQPRDQRSTRRAELAAELGLEVVSGGRQ